MDEQDIPIDIHISKLGDWLTSRRHINKDWPKSVLEIRQKINSAIQDMPEHPEITKLLLGSYINYFHCLKIIEILQETEKDSKNIFGWYTSQRMKDWQEIVNLYTKNNVYLAEMSQFLIRNVIYEIPSLRKQITKLNQMQEIFGKKQIAHAKTIAHIKETYANTCKQMGIKGENVEKELRSLGDDFEENFTNVAKLATGLTSAVDFYSDFISFTLPSLAGPKLELVKFVSERGDTTVYEWIHKEPPITIEREDAAHEVDDNTREQDNEIDFGDEAPDLTTEDIDWGATENDDQINWDITEDNGDQIDFNISEDDVEPGIVVESSGLDGGVAKGDEALSVLSCMQYRSQFINELLELEGFLVQRMEDSKGGDNIVSMAHFSSAPSTVQGETAKSMGAYVAIIKSIVGELTSTKMQHLYLIKSSPKYVKRFSNSITRRLEECDKYQNLITESHRKGQEAGLQNVELSKSLKLIVDRTVVLQTQMENAVSSKYNNRPVNLMGKV